MNTRDYAQQVLSRLATYANMWANQDSLKSEEWNAIMTGMFSLIGSLEQPATHMQIIALTRDNARNSGSPFWRCATMSGKMVNVFKHEDELKDTFHLFEAAGFGEDMMRIETGETQNWIKTPILVTCVPNGSFWNVVAVKERDMSQTPDPEPNEPDW